MATIQEFVRKLRSLPDKQKIAIIAVVVVFFALILGYFWVVDAMHSFSKIGTVLQSQPLPKIDMPDLSIHPPVTDNAAPTTVDQTTDWKTYTNTQYGFEFKYPKDFSVNNNYTTDLVLLDYTNVSGQHSFLVTVEDSRISLEQSVKTYVANEREHINSLGSAVPLSITYKPYQIGDLDGYLIVTQAADALINSNVIFKTQKRNNIFNFSYSYQAFIFEDPKQITGGAPVTADLQNQIQSGINTYNQIQAIISTFTFTNSNISN